uniref:Uncharacterized protein n=1 Tax=Ciona intestinalis TaxID=7719 RepID=H2XQ79_CIOIN
MNHLPISCCCRTKEEVEECWRVHRCLPNHQLIQFQILPNLRSWSSNKSVVVSKPPVLLPDDPWFPRRRSGNKLFMLDDVDGTG